MENTIAVTLNFAEIKKTTVKYAENPMSDFVPDVIGDLYLPKATVGDLIVNHGYQGADIIVEIGKTGDIKMMPELPAKKMTVKFNEETVSELMPAKIGSIYVPKSTLEKLGYTGDALYLSIKVPE